MKAFKGLKTTSGVTGIFQGKVRVYLESSEDVYIFNRWFFDELGKLEFLPAMEPAGGCQQVLNAVGSDRDQGVIAFGIVDRDILLRCHNLELLLETDDDGFGAARPFGDYVRVLRRWEIENYLLQPDELEDILATVGSQAPRPKRSNEEVVGDLLRHCEALIPVMAANIMFHEKSVTALAHGFGCDLEHRAEMEPAVMDQLGKMLGGGSDTQNSHKEYVRLIESFDSDAAGALEDRWEQLNRIIDGKRILVRLRHKHKLRDDYRFMLAARIREHGKIDLEVVKFINEVKTYFRN